MRLTTCSAAKIATGHAPIGITPDELRHVVLGPRGHVDGYEVP
ncbi:MAG: hypothetical protein ABSA14_12925 [Acidimicrobiales bacterium]